MVGFGVPKDSDLEPDYRVAKTIGSSAGKCRLMVEKSAKCSLRLRFHLSHGGLELRGQRRVELLGHNKPIDLTLTWYNLVVEGNYRKVFGPCIANAS